MPSQPTRRSSFTASYQNDTPTFRVVKADTGGGTYKIEKARTDAMGGTSWTEFETVATTDTATKCAALTPAIVAAMLDSLTT